MPLREAAWVLKISFSVLSDWNQGFDENMKPFNLPDRRGKATKITLEMVRVIVQAAEDLKGRGRRLRLKGFTEQLKKEQDIYLSKRKVQEILIANNLFAARTRKRRPRFYQSLRKEIPNGLLSLDGSELTVWLDEEPYKFNVELSVDVKTFAHTAFSVGDTESSDEVIRVLEAHRRDWGDPLGILCDHGSSNLSEEIRTYLKAHEIELAAAGPYNPKGNGTDEGAFSQMKRVLGTLRVDASSRRSIARSVLENVVCVYTAMRNRVFAKGNTLTPREAMSVPGSKGQRDLEREKIKDHIAAKIQPQADQAKVGQLHGLIRFHGMVVEPAALNRAEKSIKAYEKAAISASEEAFIKAVARKPERKNLAYFFGILKRIQQERDDEAYRHYCRQRYNEDVMMQLHRQDQQPQDTHCVESIVTMLVQAVKSTVQFVKELAIRKAHEWTRELMESYRYPGALKKSFSQALGDLMDLTLEEKNKIWELIEQFLNPKTEAESVTQIS
ncbi:MAG: transposase family protein [Pseudomonadota bacterium]